MKTLSTVILSWLCLLLLVVLASCAGKPPVMEHPIKLYNGQPNLRAMCRTSQFQALVFARHALKRSASVKYADRVIKAALEADARECIESNNPAFAGLAGITFEDLGVLLRFQEELLYSCKKW